MCGICGIQNFDKANKVSKPVLKSMMRVLVHRGPDDEGFFIKDNIGLGHRRLSIIDLNTGQQPLCNEDGRIVIVFNGEIYNFKELQQKLEARGHRFKTQTDTECIVHGYEEWGTKVVDELDGMFAFAIWDGRNHQLFLARDRMGKKPLYYFIDENRLIFASEIKAILQDPTVPKEIEPTSVSDYLSLLYVPAPKTIYRNIYKLPSGHWLRCKNRQTEIQQYWDIPFYEDGNHASSETEITLTEKLQDAVQARLISDVPLGAFLSGGLDSSLVVYLMHGLSQNGVTTASIGFQEKKYDELIYSRLLGQQLETDYHEHTVKPNAVDILPKLAWHLDEPHADSSAVPTYYVCKMARKAVTVALSGDGGDENFAGYTRRYYYDRLENRIRTFLPDSFRRPVFNALAAMYPKADWLPRPLRAKSMLSNLALSPEYGFFNTMCALPVSVKHKLLSADMLAKLQDYDTFSVFEHHFNRCQAKDPLSRVQYVDMKTFLVDDILMKVDKMSMANSLEVRCPLLDQHVIEYAAGLPSSLKLKGKTSKYILKKIMRNKLPDEILDRPKHGFEVPIAEWLRGDLKTFAYPYINENSAISPYFNKRTIDNMWNEHQRGIRNWSTPLWALLMFSLWHETFMI